MTLPLFTMVNLVRKMSVQNIFNLYAIIRKLFTLCHFPDNDIGKILFLYLGKYSLLLPYLLQNVYGMPE